MIFKCHLTTLEVASCDRPHMTSYMFVIITVHPMCVITELLALFAQQYIKMMSCQLYWPMSPNDSIMPMLSRSHETAAPAIATEPCQVTTRQYCTYPHQEDTKGHNYVLLTSSSSCMRVMNHNWSATKQRPHPQNVAEISCHSVLSGDRIRQCETSSGSRHKDTDHCL